ncbi:YceI family protein [Pleomorphomonas sp. JP5]|uniref:YceI family protein n=1 Tax=Pleomorphomonas sp. JP5 TaxID=2942998 RepID=UPI0020446B10|nr:YceI family protein [Pleomorphomonas sp. JP5]MCM5557002.1 YceI family protein [Pleomorphomonas sp. JP5]
MFAKLTLTALLFACPTLALAAPDSPAPSGRYEQDGPHTSVTWRIDHFGLSRYTARFVGARAKLDWNREAPAQSTLTVEIDPLEVRTDFPFPQKEDFDAKIGAGADFLAGSPIGFVSDRIVVDGENTGQVFGQLTMRGQTHPAVMDVTFNGSMAEHPIEKIAKLGFSGHMRLKRSTWGLAFALPALGDEVDVAIEIEFRPENGK